MPYKALTGLSYPPDRRVEAGEIVDDIPTHSVKWLLDQGHIENMGGSAPKPGKPAPVAEPDSDEDGDE